MQIINLTNFYMGTGNLYHQIKFNLSCTSFLNWTVLFISCNRNSLNKKDMETSAGREGVTKETVSLL